MHNGLPWGTLTLSLCSGPCPPVDSYRNEEVNTSPPEVAIPGDICKINGLFHFLTSPALCYIKDTSIQTLTRWLL